METFGLSKIKTTYIALVFLNIHLVKGGVTNSTSGSIYYGESFTLTFLITPSFTGSVTLTQDGAFRSTCVTVTCSPVTGTDVSYTPSGTAIVIVFNPVSSTHQGSWQYQNTNGDILAYSFLPEASPSAVTTEGSTEGTTTKPSTTTTTTTPSTPSTSPNKCLYFIEAESCGLINGISIAILVVITLVSLFAIGRFIIWKRNQRYLHQENNSAIRKEKEENNSDGHELNKQ